MGPRYYYEGLYSLVLLTAAGIAWLAGWPMGVGDVPRVRYGQERYRSWIVTAFVALLVAGNVLCYLPGRIGKMQGLFGNSRQQLVPFQIPGVDALTPALIIVDTDEWRAYAGLLELANPMLDSAFIFIWHRGAAPNSEVIEAFPDRNVFYYYPDEPWNFFPAER